MSVKLLRLFPAITFGPRRPAETRKLCTAVAAAKPPLRASSPDNETPLYQRLSYLTAEIGGSAKKTLDDYLSEGKPVTQSELVRCVKELRRYKQFEHALQIMEWMDDRKMRLGYRVHAIRIDLISKTEGIPAAEAYFEGLFPNAKNYLTYGSLLNCYCKELKAEKACALFDRMDELRFLHSTLPFNNLMTLYLKMGEPEKVLELVEDMKLRKVRLDSISYGMWMQACAGLDDFDGVKRAFTEAEDQGVRNHKDGWNLYSNLATIYVNAKEFKKAEAALKLLEGRLVLANREAFHYLITLYAGTSNLGEVHRIWALFKSRFPVVINTSYLVLFPALMKLKDVEGIKKRFEEWESSCRSYDVRVVNVVIKAYLAHGMYDEAVKVFEGAKQRVNVNLFKAREMFMVFLLESGLLDPALEHLKATFSVCAEAGFEWKPTRQIIDAFFVCFEKAKDVDGAEKFLNILKLVNQEDSDVDHYLDRVYVAAGKCRIRERDVGTTPEYMGCRSTDCKVTASG